MPKVNPDFESFARIKVIGVGGSGKNAVNHMIESHVNSIDFICVNTDTQDLHHSLAEKKIHIGKNLTKGIGSGMNPEIGRESAEETKAEIQEALKNADMVFIACGMGGGTGTGAAPVIARMAKEQGIITIGVVTKPFVFEGQERKRIADRGIEELGKEVDALIVIPNDRLIAIAEKETSFNDAFRMCDEVLRQAVVGISEIITTPGKINIDYADIKATLINAGPTFMGIGRGSGEDRAQEAVTQAISSPLLEIKMHGAKRVLFAISGGDDLAMHEVQEIANTITESIDEDARVIFGAYHDNNLKKGEIKVTVIATCFEDKDTQTFQKKNLFSGALQKDKEPQESQKQNMNEAERPSRITPISSAKRENPPQPPQRPEIPKQNIGTIDDDDDWNSALPSFLIKRKK